MQCSECHADNPNNAKYCENCGQPLLKVITPKKEYISCLACSEQNAINDNFCQKCGAALEKNTRKEKVTATTKNVRSVLPREERYRLARQMAVQLAQGPAQKQVESPIIYIGEKII